MDKTHAIQLLGGTVTDAAKAIGISASAVTQWPDELPDRIADRVLAAYVRLTQPDVLDAALPTPAATEASKP